LFSLVGGVSPLFLLSLAGPVKDLCSPSSFLYLVVLFFCRGNGGGATHFFSFGNGSDGDFGISGWGNFFFLVDCG